MGAYFSMIAMQRKAARRDATRRDATSAEQYGHLGDSTRSQKTSQAALFVVCSGLQKTSQAALKVAEISADVTVVAFGFGAG